MEIGAGAASERDRPAGGHRGAGGGVGWLSERSAIDRLAPTRRPRRRAIGSQNWWNLLFIHWRLPAEEVAPLLPRGLTLDIWNGDAWVGLVLFHMTGVRPWWSPPIPGVSAFHETNVRTYVQREGHDPGVWFFSLDAAQSLAVRVARWWWKLNYFRAEMTVRREGQRVAYRSRRLWPEPSGATTDVQAEFGDWLPSGDPRRAAGQAAPGTLDFFLVERYLLYTEAKGRLFRAQVHHQPYRLRSAMLHHCEQTLLPAAGMMPQGDPAHVVFSEGVNVEVFPLERVR